MMNNVTTLSEYNQRYPNIPLVRWTNNIRDAAESIADHNYQLANWLREDRPAWERPEEVICVLFDDSSFELFLKDCEFSLNDQQREAGQSLLNKLNRFCDDTPQWLDPAETLNDPRWIEIQAEARRFVITLGPSIAEDE